MACREVELPVQFAQHIVAEESGNFEADEFGNLVRRVSQQASPEPEPGAVEFDGFACAETGGRAGIDQPEPAVLEKHQTAAQTQWARLHLGASTPFWDGFRCYKPPPIRQFMAQASGSGGGGCSLPAREEAAVVPSGALTYNLRSRPFIPPISGSSVSPARSGST